jgi:hypothetical protein
MNNCPNCGAPITGDQCEYCKTTFYPAFNYENLYVAKIKELNSKIISEKIRLEMTKPCNPLSFAMVPPSYLKDS